MHFQYMEIAIRVVLCIGFLKLDYYKSKQVLV